MIEYFNIKHFWNDYDNIEDWEANRDDEEDYEYGVEKTDLSVKHSNFELMNHYKKLYDDYHKKYYDEIQSLEIKPKKVKKQVTKEVVNDQVNWLDKVIIDNELPAKKDRFADEGIEINEKNISEFCETFF